jgi:hypothetical protein
VAKGKYAHIKRGPAPDLDDGNEYRSGWERDVARLLTLWQKLGLVKEWEYEPERFYFVNLSDANYKRGPYDYLPDFRIQFSHKDEPVYWEVKGRINTGDKTRWQRFRKHFGELAVIQKPQFFGFRKDWAERIPEWESWGW